MAPLRPQPEATVTAVDGVQRLFGAQLLLGDQICDKRLGIVIAPDGRSEDLAAWRSVTRTGHPSMLLVHTRAALCGVTLALTSSCSDADNLKVEKPWRRPSEIRKETNQRRKLSF